jgi:hypothetical protein
MDNSFGACFWEDLSKVLFLGSSAKKHTPNSSFEASSCEHNNHRESNTRDMQFLSRGSVK